VCELEVSHVLPGLIRPKSIANFSGHFALCRMARQQKLLRDTLGSKNGLRDQPNIAVREVKLKLYDISEA
jgi:hypothetical protein